MVETGEMTMETDNSAAADLDQRVKSLAVPPADLSRETALAYAAKTKFRGMMRPTVGKMVLLAKLGQGGMGVVYYGVHPRLGSEVAVKVLSVQGSGAHLPEHVARFLREARLAASLRSAHLVSVIDVDRDETAGLHYIVMEFVRGYGANKWLEEYTKSKTRVPEHLALDLVIAATKGLAAAHEAGIVHRDVKPDNILIPRRADGTPQLSAAKLADLGLARTEGGGDTVTGMPGMMGTPGFMAPEQVDGKLPASRASDVFAMGATLHALLAGMSPFAASTPMQTVLHTVWNKQTPVRSTRPDVSRATAAVITQCLQPAPGDRFPDAMTLLVELEAARAGVSADSHRVRPPSVLPPLADEPAPSAVPQARGIDTSANSEMQQRAGPPPVSPSQVDPSIHVGDTVISGTARLSSSVANVPAAKRGLPRATV